MAMLRDELDDQHQDLAIDVDRLHLLATASADALPGPRLRAVLRRELLDLVAVLDQHFACEERRIDAERPARGSHAIAASAELREAHAYLRTRLQELADQANGMRIDVLKSRITDVLDELAEHERTESRLVSV